MNQGNRLPLFLVLLILASGCDARFFSERSAITEAQKLPAIVALSITKTGDGLGVIAGQMSDDQAQSPINCDQECTGTFPRATRLSLTAIPAIDSNFIGWSGSCTGHQSTCQITLESAKTTVAANFVRKATAPTFPLLVATAGSGQGLVVSNPGSITCGTLCQERFSYGTDVSLTATASPGSYFVGWQENLCNNQNPCKLKIFSVQSVTAIFSLSGINQTTVAKNLTLTGDCPPRSFTLRWPVGVERGYFLRWGTNPLALENFVYRLVPEDRPLEMSYHFVNLTSRTYYFSISADYQDQISHPVGDLITYHHPDCQ